MPPRKKAAAPTPPPLSDGDVATLRARLSAGETPRVIVRTASAAVPAGTRGNVVRVGNPKDGEFIIVRLGKDEVPFAPSELALSGRTPAKAAPPPPAVAAKPARKATPPAPAPRAKPTRARAAGRRALPPLVVTLRFGGGEWTVEAARGNRRLAKAAAVRPGAVKAFAELVDEGAVRDALIETVESCRSEVEGRASSLRAELAATEATLREYDAKRR